MTSTELNNLRTTIPFLRIKIKVFKEIFSRRILFCIEFDPNRIFSLLDLMHLYLYGWTNTSIRYPYHNFKVERMQETIENRYSGTIIFNHNIVIIRIMYRFRVLDWGKFEKEKILIFPIYIRSLTANLSSTFCFNCIR